MQVARSVWLSLFAVIGLTLGKGNGSPAYADEDHRLTARQMIRYRHVATSTWTRIVKLQDQFAQLNTIKSAAKRFEAPDHLWISYHYAQDVSWRPNSEFRPGKKIAPMRKMFSPEGVDLSLYFYEGRWPGQAVVSPIAIGKMNVVLFVDGPHTKELESLRRAIIGIICDQDVRFDGVGQHNPARRSPSDGCPAGSMARTTARSSS
jgi:hypothetical protein